MGRRCKIGIQYTPKSDYPCFSTCSDRVISMSDCLKVSGILGFDLLDNPFKIPNDLGAYRLIKAVRRR